MWMEGCRRVEDVMVALQSGLENREPQAVGRVAVQAVCTATGELLHPSTRNRICVVVRSMEREMFCFVEELKPVLQSGLEKRDLRAVGRVAGVALCVIYSNEMNCKAGREGWALTLWRATRVCTAAGRLLHCSTGIGVCSDVCSIWMEGCRHVEDVMVALQSGLEKREPQAVGGFAVQAVCTATGELLYPSTGIRICVVVLSMVREMFCFVEELKPVLQSELENRDRGAVGRVAVVALCVIDSNEMNCKAG
ncbi:uncharacterized protein EMH_0071280 [Eimeria mitis]|uniref:Uncharacterized protein n=1 Tax=Eimeria mitis TaxID=44415 RepID=U6K4T2_9EIME|nr:uncharacterized protein EMH_0071280 [Eimeria mitis]CDJ31971.1 hypothetical protein EMH_0071280 [Eimeria mitis]